MKLHRPICIKAIPSSADLCASLFRVHHCCFAWLLGSGGTILWYPMPSLDVLLVASSFASALSALCSVAAYELFYAMFFCFALIISIYRHALSHFIPCILFQPRVQLQVMIQLLSRSALSLSAYFLICSKGTIAYFKVVRLTVFRLVIIISAMSKLHISHSSILLCSVGLSNRYRSASLPSDCYDLLFSNTTGRRKHQ